MQKRTKTVERKTVVEQPLKAIELSDVDLEMVSGAYSQDDEFRGPYWHPHYWHPRYWHPRYWYPRYWRPRYWRPHY